MVDHETRRKQFARHPQIEGGCVSLPREMTAFAVWVALLEEMPTDGPMILKMYLQDAGAADPVIFVGHYTDDRRLAGACPLPEWAFTFHNLVDVSRDALGIQSLTGEEAVRLLMLGYLSFGAEGDQAHPSERDTRTPHFLAGARFTADRPGSVYLLRADNGLFKIGRSVVPESRAAELQTASPVAISLIHVISTSDCVELERLLHVHFSGRRVRGEWFELSPGDVELIRQVRTWRREGAE